MKDISASRSEASQLLAYAEARARHHRLELFTHHGTGHVRRVGATAVVRLPGCLKAAILLNDDGLPLKANTVVRTIVELAITGCWVGTDEVRAQGVWDRSIKDQQEGLKRAEGHVEIADEIRETVEELRATQAGARRPDLKMRATEAVDTELFPARRVATYMYNLLYDPLSAAAHGDIRLARLVAKELEHHMVSTSLSDAVSSGVFLLMASAVQLGFMEEYAAFLERSGLHGGAEGETPSSRP